MQCFARPAVEAISPRSHPEPSPVATVYLPWRNVCSCKPRSCFFFSLPGSARSRCVDVYIAEMAMLRPDLGDCRPHRLPLVQRKLLACTTSPQRLIVASETQFSDTPPMTQCQEPSRSSPDMLAFPGVQRRIVIAMSSSVVCIPRHARP